jgi:hypothetical protein
MSDQVLDERVLAVLPGLNQRARRGLIKKSIEQVVDYINGLTGESDGRTRYQELVDAGYLYPIEGGIEVLPPAQEILSAISAFPARAPEEPVSLALTRWVAGDFPRAVRSEAAGTVGAAKESKTNSISSNRFSVPQSRPRRARPRTPRARLAYEIFPRMCETCGIRNLPGEMRAVALTDNFKKWQAEGVSIDFIESMIWEFGRHPEWTRKVSYPAWQVFLAHKTRLIALVGKHQAREGVSRVRDNESAWLTYARRVRVAAT